ncbi:MAG: sigma 54-interacting transcriptional regulator, partial [Myxococcales bacterium]|nr:sigma 54-interacting transcriptional regulator [Myxococcales bacterium]
ETERQLLPHEQLHVRPGGIRLRVLQGPKLVDRVLRWRKRTIRGGRSLEADLSLPDRSLSGMHFELSLRGDGVWLRDLDSTNGTWMGEHRIGEISLPPGSTFEAGACEIQLVGTETVEVPISKADHFGQMYGRSAVMREIFARLERLALAGVDVVLQGKTGTGKELAARALHEHSSRRQGPFVVLDCAALSGSLASAALFGHARGAFTDAHDQRSGCVEEAGGGTLFIDEIGDLPLELQPKLLRILDRREVVRLGETRETPVDVRVIAATNRDLEQMVSEGEFRQDLFFRLSQALVSLPVLVERDDDVEFLAERFATEFGGPGCRVSSEVMVQLRKYAWPGNVRELRRAIQMLVALGPDGGPQLVRSVLGHGANAVTLAQLVKRPLKDARQAFERYYLEWLLREVGGNLTEAERRSGMSRKALREKLRRHGLRG